MMRFKDRKALVTGAAGGMGQALVGALRAEGASVAVSDRDSSAVEAEAHCDGDLLNASFCDSLPSKAAEALGGLDLVFNNAGVITRGDITAASDVDYSLTMGVNVEAPFRICRAVIPIMAEAGGGAIVNTSSCWGLRPGPNHPLYVMSKAALASLTQCLGRDHAHQGIRVNAVCPNEVDTPMLRTGFAIRGLEADKAVEELNATVPIGHIASAEEIADVMLFLASDAARYMCGALVEVNGGKPVG
ncbi:MAG: SDR family oxidoreductase [Pseudomonadota bacterium]